MKHGNTLHIDTAGTNPTFILSARDADTMNVMNNSPVNDRGIGSSC